MDNVLIKNTPHNCSLISTQIAKLIATYVFNKYQVVSVKDKAKLRPETVDRIALTLNLSDVSAPKFVEACESRLCEMRKQNKLQLTEGRLGVV